MPKEKKEKTIEEKLKDPLFVNYNILKNLEEIKKINYSMLELINFFYEKIMKEEEPKEKREGVFRSK